jgi:hypothetical protein
MIVKIWSGDLEAVVVKKRCLAIICLNSIVMYNVQLTLSSVTFQGNIEIGPHNTGLTNKLSGNLSVIITVSYQGTCQ